MHDDRINTEDPSPVRPGKLRPKERRARRWAKDIRPNERFAKVAELLVAAQTVWVVWHVVDLPGLPKHVKLIQEDAPHRVVTVALSAVADRRLYRRLEPDPSARLPKVLRTEGNGAVEPGTGGNLVPFLRNIREPGEEATDAERAKS